MLSKYLILVLTATLPFYKVSAQKNLQLVSNGKSSYTIVVPDKADTIATKAAHVLQQYLFRISNCKLPITTQEKNVGTPQIIVGKSSKLTTKDTSSLGEDGILIKEVNGNLFISGGWRKGILYSAYTFLEDYLGCKSYVAKVEVPHETSIAIPANIYTKQTPDFRYRMTWFAESMNKDYCDFHKLNYFMEDWGLWVHSFSKLLPSQEYFATHPEYFALVNGKRTPDQPDLTNPDVLRIVTDNLRKLIEANPTAKYWSVSQNDNKNYCQCDNCRKIDEAEGTPMGSLLTFVNAVAKQFPDKIIPTLAYQYSETPPKTIKPGNNVMIMLTASSEDRRIPIADQSTEAFNQNFKKWSGLTNRLFIWNYIVQFPNALSPFPNLRVIQPDIQYFSSENAKYLFEQGIGNIQGEFSQLKCYLVSKLMWNKNINFNKTMQEFLNGYYGALYAEYLNQYISLLSKNADAKPAKLSSGGNSVSSAKTFLTDKDIRAYKKIFNTALQSSDTTDIHYKRFLKEYMSVLYAELQIKKAGIAADKKAGTFNRSSYLNLLQDFYNKMRFLNLTYLNEERTKVDVYYRNYLALLN